MLHGYFNKSCYLLFSIVSVRTAVHDSKWHSQVTATIAFPFLLNNKWYMCYSNTCDLGLCCDCCCLKSTVKWTANRICIVECVSVHMHMFKLIILHHFFSKSPGSLSFFYQQQRRWDSCIKSHHIFFIFFPLSCITCKCFSLSCWMKRPYVIHLYLLFCNVFYV